MSRPESEIRLDRELRKLARHGATPGFTGRVLDALENSPPARARRRALHWALTAGVAAVAAIVILSFPRPGEAPMDRPEADSAAIKTEYEHLRSELDDLRGRLDAEDSYVYLGRAGQLDLVVDIGGLADSHDLPDSGGLQPRHASRKSSTPIQGDLQ